MRVRSMLPSRPLSSPFTIQLALTVMPFPLGQETGLYSLRMPNKVNFAFDYYYASVLAIFAYIPGKPLTLSCQYFAKAWQRERFC